LLSLAGLPTVQGTFALPLKFGTLAITAGSGGALGAVLGARVARFLFVAEAVPARLVEFRPIGTKHLSKNPTLVAVLLVTLPHDHGQVLAQNSDSRVTLACPLMEAELDLAVDCISLGIIEPAQDSVWPFARILPLPGHQARPIGERTNGGIPLIAHRGYVDLEFTSQLARVGAEELPEHARPVAILGVTAPDDNEPVVRH